MRGNVPQVKVHFKGNNDDFIIFVESAKAVQDWKADRSIPLAHFVDSFKIFHTGRQGNQGSLDAAPRNILEAEFDTKNEDEIITRILEDGNIVESSSAERGGVKNVSQGGTVGH